MSWQKIIFSAVHLALWITSIALSSLASPALAGGRDCHLARPLAQLETGRPGVEVPVAPAHLVEIEVTSPSLVTFEAAAGTRACQVLCGAESEGLVLRQGDARSTIFLPAAGIYTFSLRSREEPSKCGALHDDASELEIPGFGVTVREVAVREESYVLELGGRRLEVAHTTFDAVTGAAGLGAGPLASVFELRWRGAAGARLASFSATPGPSLRPGGPGRLEARLLTSPDGGFPSGGKGEVPTDPDPVDKGEVPTDPDPVGKGEVSTDPDPPLSGDGWLATYEVRGGEVELLDHVEALARTLQLVWPEIASPGSSHLRLVGFRPAA